jgi:four helix bundle protein
VASAEEGVWKSQSFEEWAAQVPENLKRDPLWGFEVYPKGLFLYDLAWDDCQRLTRDRRGRAIVDQLTRSAGSICANIEEGYGRGYGKEYAYFLRVSMGSARESRGWYYRARRLLPDEVVEHRMGLLDEIIAMLAPNIQRQKQYRRK